MKSLREQRSSRRRPRQLQLEPLESRRVLAPVNVPVNGLQEGDQTEPAISVVGDQVKVYYSGGQFGVGVASSYNQGQSFDPYTSNVAGTRQPAVAYDPVAGQEYRATVDFVYQSNAVLVTGKAQVKLFPSGTSGYTPGSPTIAAETNGSNQNVYVLTDAFDARSPIITDDAGMYFFRSSDGGKTWSSAQRLSSGLSDEGAALVIGSDHSVLAFWQSSSGSFSNIVMRRSTDGGVTFGEVVAVGGQHASNVQVARNPVNGDLYATYTELFAGSTGKDVMFTMSSDQGATWSVPAAVNDDGLNADQYVPTIAVAANGERLFVGFRDQRRHADQHLVDSYGAVATISGHTVAFGPNFRITNESAPQYSSETSQQYFSGKENQATADANRFYYVWSDTRNPSSDGLTTHQADLFSARIGLDGPQGPYVDSQTPVDLQVNTPVTSATATFSEAMDTSSFTVADDVVGFAGNAQGLKSTITGFSWLNDRTLQINFKPIEATGTYKLVLGPNILSKAGVASDNNFNSIAGEADDTSTIEINIERLPQYQAYAAAALPSLRLTRGAPGVLEPTKSTYPDALHIDLGIRTFTFYGRQYTGRQVHILQTAQLTFGSESPATPFLNVLSGTLRDVQVLYAFRDVTGDGIPDLIVDWQATDVRMRVQAVLELGTGSKQGTMFLNYDDIEDPRRAEVSNARSAAIGVQNTGLPIESKFTAYTGHGLGDIGVRSGMALIIRDDLRGSENLRFGDSLHAFGSKANDTMSVDYENGMYNIYRNAAIFGFGASDVHSIYLHGAGGNDVLTVTSLRSGDRVGLDGNAGNDTLTASGLNPAALFGGGGDDILLGGSGPDELEGGPGNDSIRGRAGDDVYYFARKIVPNEVDRLGEVVGGGTDRLSFVMLPTKYSSAITGATVDLRSDAKLISHDGRRVKTFAPGQSQFIENISGGGGFDHLTGNDGANVIEGDSGNDRLLGAMGNDVLTGGSGSDRLTGGRGDDRYPILAAAPGQFFNDTIVEAAGEGTDTLDFSQLAATNAVVVNLANLPDQILAKFQNTTLLGNGANLERVLGGAGNDQLTGNALANEIIGNDGNDTLRGGGGNDRLLGGAGFDSLDGGAGNDDLYGGAGDDRYLFAAAVGNEVDHVFEALSSGVDELSFAALPAAMPVKVNLAQEMVASHAGRKVWMGIKGTFLNLENATGGGGDDTLIGNLHPNRLVGGPGTDTFEGGGGTDQIVQ